MKDEEDGGAIFLHEQLTPGTKPIFEYFICELFLAVLWIRIRNGWIQKGKHDPQKYQKVYKFHFFTCWMFSFEG
jgi:hypothetical protein